eukprot:TRINITY_DN6023_c0_g1_i1.p1 TRINITY_DN6023_c0_g1~~TRINITY_DN6023_c0_g1_i1.p1  ORF type:complete len:249 (-),score=40.61 TRINITY_DN6023_c0_g1_i1:80-826(-)
MNSTKSFRDGGEPKIASRSNKWRFWLECDNNSSTKDTEEDNSSPPKNPTLLPQLDNTEKSPVKNEYLKDLVSSPIFSNRATILGFATMNCDDNSIAKVLLFKSWIEPAWEDKHNLNGGRFFLRCQTREAGKELFLRMVNMAMRGDLLPGDAYLCGLGFNTKKNSSECSVQLWHAQLPDSTAFCRLRAQMKHFHCTKVGYHPHSRSSNSTKKDTRSLTTAITTMTSTKQEDTEITCKADDPIPVNPLGA